MQHSFHLCARLLKMRSLKRFSCFKGYLYAPELLTFKKSNVRSIGNVIKETKHLTSADSIPHLEPNVLRLYSMKWCPFAQRTRLALAYKQIKHEVVNINLSDKPKWLVKKNPNGTVPILEILTINSTKPESHSKPDIIVGSMECCEWLERHYNHTPTLFKAGDQATSLTLLNIFKEMSPVIQRYITHYYEGDMKEDRTELVLSKLQHLEDRLDEDSRFVSGSTVTMTDFLLWPTFERLLAAGLVIPSDSLPLLSKWVESMSKLPAVSSIRNSPEAYHKYWESQRAKRPLYDLD